MSTVVAAGGRAVVFIDHAPGSYAGLIRSVWPAGVLAQAGHPVYMAEDAPDPAEWRRVILHAPVSPLKLAIVRDLRELAPTAEVWLSEDDDIWAAPELTRRVHEGFYAADPGFARAVRDAYRLGPGELPDPITAHERAVEAADAVLVSTPRLREVYLERGARRVEVVRNYLPSEVGASFGGARPTPGTVIWTGDSPSDVEDLHWLGPGRLGSTAGVGTLRVIGRREFAEYLGADEWTDRIGHLPSYYRAIAPAWVGVVPLAPTEFNESRSWNSALELATLGIPVVATATRENQALLNLIPGVRLVNTPIEMVEEVQQLLALSLSDREALGEELHRGAASMCLERRVDEWIAIET